MAVTPKKFVASRDFTYRGIVYSKGDAVVERAVIARMVRYGDRFIKSNKSKPATAEIPAVLTDAATTTTTVSTKEDS